LAFGFALFENQIVENFSQIFIVILPVMAIKWYNNLKNFEREKSETVTGIIMIMYIACKGHISGLR